jgi:DNA-binding NarL/FixJ family response regulator
MKVLVVDDHKLMLAGIRVALENVPDIEIVGEARSGAAVLPLVHGLSPDVVLLDIRLPQMDGLACIALLRKRYPNVKVVVLSVFNDPEHILAALKAGATGYIVKSINPADLASALRQSVEGTFYHTLGLQDDDERAARDAKLTDREIAILRCLARGQSNKVIGNELWVTEQTVKFHLTNIYRKLGVANRTEAARAAYRLGLVESPVLSAV